MTRAVRKTPQHQEPLSALDAKIGARLRDARLAVLLTQAAAGAALGEDRTTLVRWERGQRQLTVADLIRLARLYGVSASDLLNLEAPLPRAGGRREEVPTPQQHARTLITTFLDQRPDLLPQVIALITQLAEGGPRTTPPTVPHVSAHLHALIARLHALNVNALTPLAALNIVAELKRLTDDLPVLPSQGMP